MVSTNSRQSVIASRRRLPILLLIETWSAACCRFSICTICAMSCSWSASHCSIQVNGRASAAPCPCRRRTISATNALLGGGCRSEEHTSELQSLLRISYAVFCLKKKTNSKYIKYNVLLKDPHHDRLINITR